MSPSSLRSSLALVVRIVDAYVVVPIALCALSLGEFERERPHARGLR